MTVGLRVCGAAREVTGLCLVLDHGGTRILVDCGMFQGPKTLKSLNYEPFPFDPGGVDALLLTHAHIDHSGLIPKLVKQGFRGEVLATRPTRDLCSCLLPDAGHIQESEVEQLNRRNRRRGRDPVEPIYTVADAEAALRVFRTVEYEEWVAPARGIRARWWNAGHMLGSASIEIEFGEGADRLRLLVSGDIGPDAGALQPPPTGPGGGVDHVVIESTYGDEDRPAIAPAARRAELGKLVRRAAERGGAMLIPVFAVERAQEVVLDLVRLMAAGQIPAAPINMDSPLATRATKVFRQHVSEMDEPEAIRAALSSPHLMHVEDGAESARLARQDGFRIVLAGSGMCEAGRIRHHLASGLWDARNVVALVGFQAAGTLGRLLQDGAARVRIQGETVHVAAHVARIEGYSAHADGPELGRWLAARGPVSGGVFLVHGEPEAIEGMAKRVVGRGIAPDDAVIRPVLDESFRLSPGARPERVAMPGRRAEPAGIFAPDWHNQRAALLLRIEEALENARDTPTRDALIARLRDVVEGG